jgi:hypothetical protein
MALATINKVGEALRSALELQASVELHFSEDTIFCGVASLQRGHPIFQRLAEKMWRFGIAGLTFERGATKELEELISLLNYGERHQCSRQDFEKRVHESRLEHIKVVLLHTLVSFSEKDEVEALDSDEQQLWEELIRDLAVVHSPTDTEGEPAPQVDPVAVEKLSDLIVDDDLAPDYATAVIDYMKRVEKHHRQDALLQETNLGRKLADFLGTINPELRHQIMSSALTNEEGSPDLLKCLINLDSFEHLVDSLRRINSDGAQLPTTIFRTLSVMGSLRRNMAFEGDEESTDGYSAEDFQSLIGNLFSEDQVDTYMSEEYERTMGRMQRRTERLAKNPDLEVPELDMEFEEIETHFVDTGFALLERFPDEEDLPQNLVREGSGRFSRRHSKAP